MMNRGRVRSGSSSGSPVKTVYTYIQPGAKKYGHVRTYGQGLERVLTHTYGQGSCTWRGQGRQQRRPVHRKPTGWVRTEKLHHVHREATECVLFIGSQPAWTEQPKRGLAYRRTEETAFCSTTYDRNGILFTRRGLAYRKTKETDFSSTSYGRNGVLFIGRGVAYRKTKETEFSSTSYGRNGVLFIARGVAYHKTGLHGLLFIHRQPPPASTCYYSSMASPSFLHGLLFI